LAFSAFLFWTVSKINVGGEQTGENEALDEMSKASGEELVNIYKTIQEGAAAFLWYETHKFRTWHRLINLITSNDHMIGCGPACGC
jgi:hypothetical protein